MTTCPEPDLCQAGAQCAGRCRPRPHPKTQILVKQAIKHGFPLKDIYGDGVSLLTKPRTPYFQEQLNG